METPDYLAETTVQEFRDQVRGEVLQASDDGYDDARTIWNGMIDKHPGSLSGVQGLPA